MIHINSTAEQEIRLALALQSNSILITNSIEELDAISKWVIDGTITTQTPEEPPSLTDSGEQA